MASSALTLSRMRQLTALLSPLALSVTSVRHNYVYKDPNYKTVPSTHHFKRKHYNPRFKKDRAMKVMKVELPDVDDFKNPEDMTPDEIRAKMKEKGIQPDRPWMEKPVFVSSTSATVEPYVPPEGDGKVSVASKEGAKQRLRFLEKKGKSMMATRKIRQFDEDFDTDTFANEAQQIYIDTHNALVDFDEDRLHQLVTERAYPKVVDERKNKTLRWQFIRSLEPPRVVHLRTADIVSKENIFAQVTVRFHSKQTLAVYDRFGRLLHGSEVVARDVLEYVVFEKHIANMYGIWRIHDKIVPDWMPPRQPIRRTYKVEEEVEEEEEEVKEAKPTEEEEEGKEAKSKEEGQSGKEVAVAS